MKKKYILNAALGLGVVFAFDSSNAIEINNKQSNDGWYIDVSSDEFSPSGQFTGNDNLLTGHDGHYNFSVSVGYKQNEYENLFNNIRVETEVSYSNFGFSTGGIESGASVFDIMENAFYNFDNVNDIKPYIGVGLGLSNIAIASSTDIGRSDNESFTLPAYQALAGALFQLEAYPSATAHVGYKYFATIGKPSMNAVIEPSAKNAYTQNFEAGIKVDF